MEDIERKVDWLIGRGEIHPDDRASAQVLYEEIEKERQ